MKLRSKRKKGQTENRTENGFGAFRSLDLSVSLPLALQKLLNEAEMFDGSNTECKPKAKLKLG